MTIAYDRTETVNSPQKWDMYRVIGIATFLELLGVVLHSYCFTLEKLY